MITLESSNNTILLYTNLIDGVLPNQVEVILTNKEDKKILTFTCDTVIDNHVCLIKLDNVISRNKGQNNLVIKDIDSDKVYYKETAKIK